MGLDVPQVTQDRPARCAERGLPIAGASTRMEELKAALAGR